MDWNVDQSGDLAAQILGTPNAHQLSQMNSSYDAGGRAWQHGLGLTADVCWSSMILTYVKAVEEHGFVWK